jgi:outer membrane protein TolC
MLLVTTVFVAKTGAQGGYENVLNHIEENNATLAALRERTEAQKIDASTGIWLANPEIEFNYLWGSPKAIGKRTDISIRQTFDFPTAYIDRNRLAGLQSDNAGLAYKAGRTDILLSARQVCINLTYQNNLVKEYSARLKNAESIAVMYKIKLEKGDANAIENNKAQLNRAAAMTELSQIESERDALLAELRRLNGGKEIVFQDCDFPDDALPADFEGWYAEAETKSPVLQYVRAQIAIDKQQLQLNKSLAMPKFSAGYMSEKIVGEHFQGISVGVSIPLFENKNRIKHAKAQVKASEAALEDDKLQFYYHLQSLYLKAAALRQNKSVLKQSLSENNSEKLLKKAFDAGEISLINYLLELEYYYDAIVKLFETERDYELAIAELKAMEL